MRQHETILSAEGVESLIAGASTLEQVIAARRSEQSPPGINAVVARLEAVASDIPSTPAQDA